jgi:glutathione S-transferase
VPFHNKDVAAQLAMHAPSRTVPTLLLDEETPVWDSLAIAEELASRHPDAGLGPAPPTCVPLPALWPQSCTAASWPCAMTAR